MGLEVVREVGDVSGFDDGPLEGESVGFLEGTGVDGIVGVLVVAENEANEGL